MTAPTSSPTRRVSLRTKLAVAILLAGLLPLLAAMTTAFLLARDALVSSAERRMAIMRDEKRRQVVDHFETAARTTQLLAASPGTQTLLPLLAEGWDRLPDELGWPRPDAAAPDPAAAKLRDDALRALAQAYAADGGGEAGAPGPVALPSSPSGVAAQVLFVAENPHPGASRRLLDGPSRAKVAYGEAHRRIHPYLRDVVQTLGYDDLLLVDARTGDVLYSVAKELDFGSNVREGPYAGTALSKAARRALEADVAHAVVAEDFELYPPSGGRPAAFLASAVRVDGKTVGALVVQLGAAPVDRLLAREVGVARSTETFLVGPDRTMRSSSPFETSSTFLRKKLDSLAVRESLAGNSDVAEAADYRGVPSIVAWTPVDVVGLRYGLVRKVDEAEELAPVRSLLTWMAVLTAVLVVLSLIAAQALSRSLSRPIQLATQRLQSTAQELLSTAQQQQAGASEAAAAVEETRQTFTGVLGAAQSLRKVGTEVLGNAEVSQRNAQTIGRRIQELSGSTARIGELLTLVREIANRSDLLALNAALEGTKAGEAGRGFSLVATQMQRLAEEVMGSVKKIEGLTQEISRSSAGAVLAAEEADKASTRTTASAHAIAEAVQTQQTATEQVSVAMNEIATVAGTSVEASRAIVASSNDLLGVAEELRGVMGGRA